MLATRNPNVLKTHAPQDEAHARLTKRLQEPTLYDTFLAFLAANDQDIPSAVLTRDVTQPHEPYEALQDALVNVYRTRPILSQVCERMVDLDEALQEWRYRHVKMVERTIGTKPGTGGSAGVEYLKSTLFRPLFADLWIIRPRL